MSTKKVERTSTGLASLLFDELDALVAGKSTPQQARAKSSIATTIISIKRLEMDMARFVASERLEIGGENLKSISMG